MFLTAVVVAAVRYGLLPSMLDGAVASLCYNFFFLPPLYAFTITDPNNVASFFSFFFHRFLLKAGRRSKPIRSARNSC